MKLVTAQDFEAFVQLTGAKVVRPVYNNSSKYSVEIALTDTVVLRVNATALLKTSQGTFYANNDGWTHVRVPTIKSGWIDGDYNLMGKGCRAAEVHGKVVEVLSLL